ERLEPGTAALDDVRQVAERLDVVDDRRLPVEALDRRKGRLEPRLAPQSLERVDQRRLLTADVRPGAAVHDHLAVETAAEDVPADQPGAARLLDRALEEQTLVVVLAADVDERGAHLQRVGRDEQALDELVRALVDQVAVFEARGLGFVRVADEIAWERVLG